MRTASEWWPGEPHCPAHSQYIIDLQTQGTVERWESQEENAVLIINIKDK